MPSARTHAAVAGFDRAAGAYERGRPGYPTAAVAYLRSALDVRPGDRVVELGAGTGKFTRALAGWDARLIAIEPTEGMRSVFHRELPKVSLIAGTAEAIPLRSEQARAVVVAQAFHWFREPEALEEIGRVLAPRGALGLVWNLRDESLAWTAALGRLIESESGGIPRTRDRRWVEAFASAPAFDALEERTFPHAQRLTPEGVVDRVLSISAIGLLPPDRREEVAERVRALLDADPQTRGRPEVELPYRTEVYVARRREARPRGSDEAVNPVGRRV